MRWGYYATAARRAGVPDMWCEDAGQDIALACWLDGDTATVVYREAIDCARRYGPYTRRGNARPLMVPLDVARQRPGPEDVAGRVALAIAMRTWAASLTGKQRAAISKAAAQPQRFRGMSALDSAHASAARRKLRAALA